MRIATFNINGVNNRLGNLLDWLGERAPDVVCLQELKAPEARFPSDALEQAGYDAIWCGQARWNGVAILARGPRLIPTRRSLPGDPGDDQARYLEAAVGGIVVASIYAPNGNPQPGPKFDYKLAWLERLRRHAADLLSAGAPVVLAGDYNVVPAAEDIYETTSYDDNALVQPEARAAFAGILDEGYHDAVRRAFPEGPVYTFWDYRRRRWERDAGMRLDHILLNHDALQLLASVEIDRGVRGRDNASDHAPVVVEFRSATGKA